jgi:hypothetical protein
MNSTKKKQEIRNYIETGVFSLCAIVVFPNQLVIENIKSVIVLVF